MRRVGFDDTGGFYGFAHTTNTDGSSTPKAANSAYVGKCTDIADIRLQYRQGQYDRDHILTATACAMSIFLPCHFQQMETDTLNTMLINRYTMLYIHFRAQPPCRR